MTVRRPAALTPRQRQVLDLIAKGWTNAQIGEQLGISLDGAKWHVSEVLARLNLESREEAADYWRAEQGLRPRLLRFARGAGVGLSWRIAGGIAGAAAVATGVAIVALAIVANSDGDGAEPAGPSATAVPTSPAPSPTEPSRRTGIPEVDAIIDLILAKDMAALVPLFDGHPEACTNDEERFLGSPPPCPPGVADGTEILTVRATICHRQELEHVLAQRFEVDRELYAAFEPRAGMQYRIYPNGEYAIVFTAADDGAERFDIRDGRLTGMSAGCSPGPEQLRRMIEDADRFIVAPLFPIPTPTPTPAPDASGYPQHWATGESMLDIAVQALVSGNRDRIAAHLLYQPVLCEEWLGPDLPAFCEGAAPGTPIPALPVRTCGESELVHRDDTGRILDRISDASNRIYAANHNLPVPGDRYRFSDAPYVAVFNVPAIGEAFTVMVDEGMIVSVHFGCAGDTAARQAAGMPRSELGQILPPPR